MEKRIIERLTEIEHDRDIHILHAVESGSRAWGFASPDSDYDVRFIYARPKDYYLQLEKFRDVIELPLEDGILDINGWDIQKTLRLLHCSNPTLFEWSNSPIVYKTTEVWYTVQKEIDSYFVAKSGLYHYLNMATGNYREYLKGDTVKLKKYFYVIRPILACKWILDKDCPPPMLFTELVESQLEDYMKPTVQDLLDRKMGTPEIGEGPVILELNEYIGAELLRLKPIIDALPHTSKQDWKKLNQLFTLCI